jgi:hypothetical protein
MLERFTPSARRTVVRSGLLAMDAGRRVLGTDWLLLGLTETDGLDPALESFSVTPDAVRAEMDRRRGEPARRPDRELLAAIGIDLDEVRRRASRTTSTRVDDPELWLLRRSRARPLRLVLSGPPGALALDGPSRKVTEVALWARRRDHSRRPLATAEDLLWGLLADGANESVRILHGLGVDLRRLWSDLRRCYQAA